MNESCLCLNKIIMLVLAEVFPFIAGYIKHKITSKYIHSKSNR